MPFRQPHSLVFDRVANFRDMGGHTTRDGGRVRFGRLFRCGHLGHASDDDLSRLETLALGRIFDFRTKADIVSDGADRVPKGASYLRLPMPDPAFDEDIRAIIVKSGREGLQELFGDGKAIAMMVQAAEGLVRDRCEAYGVFLKELANAESHPALFHCSAGKDRAGWAGTLVLLTLGVEQDQVLEQYLLSNRNLDAIRERVEGAGDAEAWGELMQPFLEVRREYIEASLAAVHADWGDFDRYLHDGLGVTHEQREQIRELLLE